MAKKKQKKPSSPSSPSRSRPSTSPPPPLRTTASPSKTSLLSTKPSSSPTPVGGYVLAASPIEINPGRPRTTLKVRNTGDRPIQVGSHFHFFETNRYLQFDRAASFGLRLDIPANTAIRFEPGDEKEVTLVPYGGKRFAFGFNNLVDGWTGDGPTPDYRPNFPAAIRRATQRGFKTGK
jgi:urease subunit beta